MPTLEGYTIKISSSLGAWDPVGGPLASTSLRCYVLPCSCTENSKGKQEHWYLGSCGEVPSFSLLHQALVHLTHPCRQVCCEPEASIIITQGESSSANGFRYWLVLIADNTESNSTKEHVWMCGKQEGSM